MPTSRESLITVLYGSTATGAPGDLYDGEFAFANASGSNKKLFIGSGGNNTANWVGAVIEDASTINWSSVTSENNKLPTQYAVKSLANGYLPLAGGSMTGDITLGTSSEIIFTATGGGGGIVKIQAPAATTSNAAYTFTLPENDGAAAEVLTTNGSGVLSWSSAGTATNVSVTNDDASTTGYITFTTATSGATPILVDSDGLTYNASTDTLSLAGDLALNGGDLTTTATGTATLFNDNATQILIGTGAASDVRVGKSDNSGTTRIYGTANINGGTLSTSAVSSSIFDTTATTLDIGGAATILNLGHDGTSASTTGIATGATASGSTKVLNLGTSGAAGSTTNVNIGSLSGGTTTVNSSTIIGAASIQNLFNTVATTLNFAGAASTINMGAASGTSNIKTPNLNFGTTADSTIAFTVPGSGPTTANLFNSLITTMSVGGAASTLTLGATSGTANIRNPTINLGNTTASVTTNSGASSNHLTLSPYGEVRLQPTSSAGVGGTRPSVIVQNDDSGSGQVQVSGGDLYLGRRSSDLSTYTQSRLIFEGDNADGNDTTLTATSQTGNRSIALPDATGTIALVENKLSAFASTTSSELAGVISDETGTGALVFANTPTLVTPILGTPQSGTLSNCTGLPVSGGLSGLGTGVATFLATPSSANLASAVTDETGTGALVFANTPTISTPVIDSISSSDVSGTVTFYSNITDGTIRIGNGLTTGNLQIAASGTGATSIAIGHTNSTITLVGSIDIPFTSAPALATDSSGVIQAASTTGSGSTVVLGTSPTISTSLVAGTSSIGLFDSTATAVDAFGATTTLNLGHDGTSASTTGIATGATGSGLTKTVNIGTNGAAGSTTNINLGSASGGTVAVVGNATVGGSLTVTGDLTVNGDTVTQNVSTITVEDPLIKLASGNSTSDLLDIGFYGLYDTSGSQDLYCGLFRDRTDGKFRLFVDSQVEPTTEVNTAATGYAVATLVANIRGGTFS